jgi:y4mF family transcriptional regulator
MCKIHNGDKMQIKDAKSFGAAIRAYRKQQGMTQLQLSAVANTSPRFIGALENGKPTVQLERALRVAWMLGMRFEAPKEFNN